MRYRNIWTLLAVCGVATLACLLYVPFLGNPMVFDDLSFFSGSRFAYYAATPFGLDLRLFPYFTLAFTQVEWGVFPPWNHAQPHRIINLAFHIATGMLFFLLLKELLTASKGSDRLRAMADDNHVVVFALAGAVLFLVHPVAVYGVAYLVQRTIIFATFFSLLSILLFERGLRRRTYSDGVAAAVAYAMAVFSKEHSLLLPAVAVLLVLLARTERGFAMRYCVTYLVGCLPTGMLIVELLRSRIGAAYEPGFEMLLGDARSELDAVGGAWFVSAITQSGLFFRYFLAWLLPDTNAMSIDLRVDFIAGWSLLRAVAKVTAFCAFGIIAIWLLSRRGRLGLIGFGMLYSWILFGVEFGAIRFQEPYVLYRSYLWAPGFIVVAIALLRLLPIHVALVPLFLSIPMFYYQAYDRLMTFSSALALWEDAVAKLPTSPVPWGSRTLFSLAGEQVYAGQLGNAMQTADRCIEEYPKISYCHFSRGAIHMYNGQFDDALLYINRSLALNPKSGIAHHHQGLIMEKLGQLEQARAAYERAYELGFMGGLYRLNMMDGKTDTTIRLDRQSTRETGHK